MIGGHTVKAGARDPNALAPRAVLRAARDGTVASLAPAAGRMAGVWGCQATAGECIRALTIRAPATTNAAARAAIRALAFPPPGADEPRRDVDAALDAWLQRVYLMTVRADGIAIPPTFGADLPRGLAPHVSVRAAANEWGALLAMLSRLWATWNFPLCAAARDVCGEALARKGPAVRADPTLMAWPGDVWAALLAADRKRAPPKTTCADAAVALAATIGSPVTLTRCLKVSEVTTLMDKKTASHGAVVGFGPRPLGAGRKVTKTTLVAASLPTLWTGGSGPLVAQRFLPWWRRMRDEGQTFVFPAFKPGSAEEYDGSEAPIGERALQQHLKALLGNDAATWHWLRRGVEQALNTVHRHPDVGGPPIDTVTKNAITGRSNIPQRGSQDSYVNEVAGTLFAATRNLYKMSGAMAGGLVVPAHDSDVGEAEGDAPFETECADCGAELPELVGGSMCDNETCFFTLCKKCWPHPARVSLWCPEHAPKGWRRPPRRKE